MKTNDNMLEGGKLKPEYRQSWADYFVRFIRAYQQEGIPIWGLTVQNEPMAVQTWESCIYTAEEERDFVRDYLGPTLVKNGLSNGIITGEFCIKGRKPFWMIPRRQNMSGVSDSTGMSVITLRMFAWSTMHFRINSWYSRRGVFIHMMRIG